MGIDAASATPHRRRRTQLVPLNVRRLPYRCADAVQARVDERALRRDHPGVARAVREARGDAVLRRQYDAYVGGVSSWDWAVSWPTSCVLMALCEHVRPGRILDLGSGLSTYTFASWAQRAGHVAEIVSIDDSPEWLARTRAFLDEHGLAADLHTPDVLEDLAPAAFDLVFDDIGRIEQRAQVIPAVMRLTAPGGLVVLDDMNVRGYRAQVRAQLDPGDWSLYSIRNRTLDAKGRFAVLGVAPGRPTP